jgi:MFS family permease
MFQFNIVFGILIAFVSNALLAGIGENAWRWMLGVAAFPSLIYAAFCFGLPESPRWLLSKKGDREAGLCKCCSGSSRTLQKPKSQPRRIRSSPPPRNKHRRDISGRASSQADHARHPDCLLQSTLRHQCDPVFRAAHL